MILKPLKISRMRLRICLAAPSKRWWKHVCNIPERIRCRTKLCSWFLTRDLLMLCLIHIPLFKTCNINTHGSVNEFCFKVILVYQPVAFLLFDSQKFSHFQYWQGSFHLISIHHLCVVGDVPAVFWTMKILKTNSLLWKAEWGWSVGSAEFNCFQKLMRSATEEPA